MAPATFDERVVNVHQASSPLSIADQYGTVVFLCFLPDRFWRQMSYRPTSDGRVYISPERHCHQAKRRGADDATKGQNVDHVPMIETLSGRTRRIDWKARVGNRPARSPAA